MSRDDLFDDDPPEEKSAPEKPDVAEDADEEFFFEITDDDSGTDESPAEQPVAGEPLVDEPMVEEPSLEMRKTTGGSSQRILMLLLLLVVLIAAGYFFMGDLLLPPAPEPAITVKTSQPQKMKIPQRKQVEQEQQAVKEVVMPAERVAEENAPVPPEKAVSDATVAGSSPVDNTEPLAAATEASGQQEEGEVAADSAEPAEVAQAEPVAETSEPVAEKSEPIAEKSEPIAEKSEPMAGEAPAVAVSTSEKPPAPVAPAASDYVLQVGAFVVDSNLEITLDKVKKLGFDPVVLERRKSTTMTRLRVGAYPEPVAREKLQELQQLIASAFLLHEEQQMVLYAGSYYNVNRARSMADKLFQHDIRIEEEPVEIQVPMKIVRFGKFHDSAAASVVAGQAKKSGLDVLVVKRN